MANINIDQFNNIENINIGGTALLCSSNPHCALDLQYNNEECVVERQGTILSIKLKNSKSTISALAKKWKLDMILVRGPPKIYNTFQNSILQNSLQFDLIHSLEGKKSNSETYVIVSFVAQINDIYSNNPSYSEINKIQIPSKANNYAPININLSPNSFFPTNENSFYQYNIPKTTRFNQIYMKNVRYLSSTFFNLFNNNILGGNYATLFNNYLETSRLPVSPNPIFFNQNMPMYPLGTIMDCKTGCRKPDGNILESKPVENNEDSSIVPKIVEKLDAQNNPFNLPAKCFPQTPAQPGQPGQPGQPAQPGQPEQPVTPGTCENIINLGGKNFTKQQMITSIIFTIVIAFGVLFVLYKMGIANQSLNSNSKKVSISLLISWLGVFIIFLVYYIVFNGKNWKVYEEDRKAGEKEKNAYAGITWSSLLLNMIILAFVAIYFIIKQKVNISDSKEKIFKYGPLVILFSITIAAIVIPTQKFGKVCSRSVAESERQAEQARQQSIREEEREAKKKKDTIPGVIVGSLISIIICGLLSFNLPIKFLVVIIVIVLVLIGLFIPAAIFETKKSKLIKEVLGNDLPDDPDCYTPPIKDNLSKLKYYFKTFYGLMFALIPVGFLLVIKLVNKLSEWKTGENFPNTINMLSYFAMVILYEIVTIAIIKNKKIGNTTAFKLCNKVGIDLQPMLITKGVFLIAWVGIILYFIFFRRKATDALESIRQSNISNANKKILSNVVDGSGLYSSQAQRNQAAQILKSNPALASKLAKKGITSKGVQTNPLQNFGQGITNPLNPPKGKSLAQQYIQKQKGPKLSNAVVTY